MANEDIQGTVVDSTGNPVAGATVYVWRADLAGSGGVVETATTNSQGEFFLDSHDDATSTSETWHVAAKPPNPGTTDLQFGSAWGVEAAIQIPFGGFESGDTSLWDTTKDLSVTSNTVYSGSYAGRSNGGVSAGNGPKAATIPSKTAGGKQISEFSYFWRETSSQYGSGVRLVNSNGNIEMGMATDNPQWYIEDANGPDQVKTGNNYENWTYFEASFDWGAGTFSTYYEDVEAGIVHTESARPLKKGVDIEKIRIDQQNQGRWDDSGNMDSWWDDFSITV